MHGFYRIGGAALLGADTPNGQDEIWAQAPDPPGSDDTVKLQARFCVMDISMPSMGMRAVPRVAFVLSKSALGAFQPIEGSSGDPTAADAFMRLPLRAPGAAAAFLHSLDATPRCAHCAKGGAPGGLRWCSRCRTVRYCSPACQKADWRTGHKQSCRNF